MSARPQGLRRQRVSSEIITVLVQRIASGDLVRGSRLPNERSLAAQFGVSQPTIREAMRALDAMGLVEVRHGSGTYVRGEAQPLVDLALRVLLQIEDVTILDVIDVRSFLGEYSARRAATEATEEEIDAIRQAVSVLDDDECLSSIDSTVDAVIRFQTSLSAASHNPLLYAIETFLITLIMQLQAAGRKSSLESWQTSTRRFSPERHHVVDELQSGDPDRVAKALHDYLLGLYESFENDQDLLNARLSDSASFDVLGRSHSM